MQSAQAQRLATIRFDLIIAFALALVMSVGWTLTDWPRLSQMLLPDHDDMLRLAQVRDWIAGQGTNDWTQYRMAPPNGAPMHWSRINDIGMAALILPATPVLGQANAELFAILAYPGILLACAIFLSARIARVVWGPSAGLIAAVLTALAYPGITVFVPGRVDHHALQVVLIQTMVLMLMRKPSWSGGALAGALTAVTLVVGLETIPQVAALMAVMAMAWVVRGEQERTRIGGFALGLGAATAAFLTFLRPTYWPGDLCDAFTPASSTGSLAVAAALGVMAAWSVRLSDWRHRIATGGALGAFAVGGTLWAFPGCLSGPYGEMDPFLRSHFMPYIVEANGAFSQPRPALTIAVAGLLMTATATSIWMLARDSKRWAVSAPIAAVVVTSALVTLFQIRGAYIGAPLSAPVLAGLVVAARERTHWRVPAVLAAWQLGAGIVYAAVPYEIEEFAARPEGREIGQPKFHVACSEGNAWRQVDSRPKGVVMAGTSVAAYVIGATRHATIGAGYHRNDTANMAMYRFFLSNPSRSLEIAREWNVDYVLVCPGDFSEIGVPRTYRDSTAARLQRGQPPAWLEPLPLRNTPMRFYRIRNTDTVSTHADPMP